MSRDVVKSGGRFGRYRLLAPLASGGMAVVYRAVLDGPSGFEREVAIKRIRPDLEADPAFRTMLLDEARVSARLKHPNIVQVLECGEVEGELYIAMELLEGFDLRTILKRVQALGRSVPPPLCAWFGSQLAAALHHAHTLSDTNGPLHVVHRDLSPTNLILTLQGVLKLLDFGIAKAAVTLRDHQTRTGVVKGKFSYMSPEQAGGLEVDHRSDLFALGIVLAEMLTLQPPFRGANDLATVRLIREGTFAPVTSLVSGLAPEWDSILAQLLAVDPAQRFQSGDAVERALLPLAGNMGPAAAREFLQSLGLSHQVASSTQMPTGSAELEVAATPALGSSVPTTRRKGPWVAAGAGVLVVVAAMVVALTRPPAQSSFSPPTLPQSTPALLDLTPTTSEPPAPDPTVVLEVRGPRGAKLWVDGVLQGQLPSVQTLPSRALSRSVRVEKAGFVTFERVVPGDSSVLLETTLVPAPRKKTGAAHASDVPDPFR